LFIIIIILRKERIDKQKQYKLFYELKKEVKIFSL